MQRDYKWLKITLSVMIIVVLLAYAFIAYMPHGHECADADCVLCNMVDSSIGLNSFQLSFFIKAKSNLTN